MSPSPFTSFNYYKPNNLTIEQFNKLYPIGTKVRYYPVCTIVDEWEETKTDSEAYDMYGIKMVSLERGRGAFYFPVENYVENVKVVTAEELWEFLCRKSRKKPTACKLSKQKN